MNNTLSIHFDGQDTLFVLREIDSRWVSRDIFKVLTNGKIEYGKDIPPAMAFDLLLICLEEIVELNCKPLRERIEQLSAEVFDLTSEWGARYLDRQKAEDERNAAYAERDELKKAVERFNKHIADDAMVSLEVSMALIQATRIRDNLLKFIDDIDVATITIGLERLEGSEHEQAANKAIEHINKIRRFHNVRNDRTRRTQLFTEPVDDMFIDAMNYMDEREEW
jgi:hypothetical protein